jgi:hypothetical protein
VNGSKELYPENELAMDKKETLFYNRSCSIEIKINELKK